MRLRALLATLIVLQPGLAQAQDSPFQVGVITAAYGSGSPEVCREINGEDFCQPAVKGMPVYSNEFLRTRGRSRMRVELTLPDGSNAGWSSIDMKPGSTHGLTRYAEVETRGGIRAVLRSFTRNWGRTTAFWVTRGTALCGIRGTDY